MFGAYYFGQPYFGQGPALVVTLPTERLDVCDTTALALVPVRRVTNLTPIRNVGSLNPRRDVRVDCEEA